ncbi:MAG: hypothetical protein ACFCUX_03390 [Candidatus Methylacidiphilales bacterium]
MKEDPMEGQRFAIGCTAVLVAVGVLILAFVLGVYSTYRSYRADPAAFEKNLKEEYRQMEQAALEKEAKATQESAPPSSPSADTEPPQ